MLFGWFGTVIRESEGGYYNDDVDTSFRMGMGWFIFSEVMFFACFFGALFYARGISVPWLGGASNNFFTNELTLAGLQRRMAQQWPGQCRRCIRSDGRLGRTGAEHRTAAYQRRHPDDSAPCDAGGESCDV